jgi:hypothetical protein
MPVHLPTPNFANWPRSPANLALSPSARAVYEGVAGETFI